jgi:hypothetical protein
LTGIKNNRIFAAASTTRQKVKKLRTERFFKIGSLRQRPINVLIRDRESCSVTAEMQPRGSSEASYEKEKRKRIL